MRVKSRISTFFICLIFSAIPMFLGPEFGYSANYMLNPPLVFNGSVTHFLISPNCERVVYRADQYTDGDFYLFSSPLEEGGIQLQLNPEMVTSGDIISGNFDISTDSRWVVYKANQDYIIAEELYSVPIDHSNVNKINSPLYLPEDDVENFKISADSSRVVYRAPQDGNHKIELYSAIIEGSITEPNTKLNRSLCDDCDVQDDFKISADSRWVVYRAGSEKIDLFEDIHLYIVPIEGGTAIKINSPTTSWYGSYWNKAVFVEISPDSSRVVYLAEKGNDNVYNLYSVPISGLISTQLTDTTGSIINFQISPDSKWVVYWKRQEDVYELYSVPIDGGSVIILNSMLVPGGDVEDDYKISADSNYVVYRADDYRDNVFELYSVPIGGGSVTRLNSALVSGGDVTGEFQISPDSRRVVYRADQAADDVYELYSVPIGGGNVTKLNSTLVPDGDVSYAFKISPDSKHVVYRADQQFDEVFALYDAPIEGGSVMQLNGPLGTVMDDFKICADSKSVVYRSCPDGISGYDLYRSSLLSSSLPSIVPSLMMLLQD